MLSRKTKGCGTFKDCNHANIHLDAPDPMQRVRNWYSFYCQDKKAKPSSLVSHKSQPQLQRLQQQLRGVSATTTSTTTSSSSVHVMDCLPGDTESSPRPSPGTHAGTSPSAGDGGGSTDTDIKATAAAAGASVSAGASPGTSAIPSFRCFTSWDSNWTLNRQDKSNQPNKTSQTNLTAASRQRLHSATNLTLTQLILPLT